MFAVLQPPIFGTGAAPQTSTASPVLPTTLTSPYRPVRPSPLSSSPLRASSPLHASSPALDSSPIRASSPLRAPTSPPASSQLLSQHDTQSSPIQPSSSSANTASSPWLSIAAFAPSMPPQTTPADAPEPTTASTAIPPPAPAPPLQTFLPAPPAKNPFRFSACPARAVPRVQQSRDATRQTRRSLFLRNVRQRADDRSYDRRNLENELQKLEWWSLEREIREAKETDATAMLTENDFDDAAEWMQPSALRSSHLPPSSSSQMMDFGSSHGYLGEDAFAEDDDEHDDHYHVDEEDDDERMAEMLAREEEAELEALIASMEEAEPMETETAQALGSEPVLPAIPQAPTAAPAPAEPAVTTARPESMAFSDDGDYDAIFAELMSQQQQQQQQLPQDNHLGEDMDMA